MKKTLLVLGGSGFIGTNFINIVKEEFNIINIDKLSYSGSFFKQHTKNKKYFKFYKLNLLNYNKFKNLLKTINPHYIINFAAESHVDRSINNPSEFAKNNILSVINILNSIKENKKLNKTKLVKYIHISTDEVFGDIETGKANEISKYNPSSPYSASKASADFFIKAFSRTFHLDYQLIYCTNNYGSFQNIEKFIPKTIISLLSNKKIQIYGNGKQIRNWIHVNDHCRAILKILRSNKKNNEICISSKESLSNLDLTIKLIKIFEKKFKIKSKNYKNYLLHIKDRPGHDIRYSLSNNLLKKKYHWNQKISIEDGLEKTFEWYYQNYDKFFKNKNINNLLKRLGNS